MAVATVEGTHSSVHHENSNIQRNFSGKRRIFVQTETGVVLALLLDRVDNAHTVKRKLQVALNFPTEERSLIYGDRILKNDFSGVKNDSPVLLARNFMQRSLSSPCLSPSGEDLTDQSGSIEILAFSRYFPKTKELVEAIGHAIEIGIDPIPISSGLGGAYFFRNSNGENVAIVKPIDEEPYAPNNPKGFVGRALGQPGIKHTVRVGETGYREVAAYLLDYDHFANVPTTALVKIRHAIFNVNDDINGRKQPRRKEVSKLASLQEYISHDYDASECGTSSFPVTAVHRIGILDIRILNTDRHAGNILVKKLDRTSGFGQVELFPIDHGLSLPENLEDPYFEWLHWPQASVPFSEEEIQYINNLNPIQDCVMLKTELPMIREASLRVLLLCTTFLKEGTTFGLCLSEMGEMMTRELRRHEEKPSKLELICIEARRLLEVRDYGMPNTSCSQVEVQFDMSHEEGDMVSLPCTDDQQAPSKVSFGSNTASHQNPLFKLLSKVKEDEVSKEYIASKTIQIVKHEKDSKLPQISVGEKSWIGHWLAGTSSRNKSVKEQLPVSSSFVRLDDLNREEWIQFLENFRMLLAPAFANRKAVTLSRKQSVRLGTSCQF